MKHLITLILFALLLAAPAFATQQVLKLTDTRTGKTEIVKPGARIVYQLLSDSSIYTGKLEKITAFELQVNGEMISLSKIRIIDARSKGEVIAGRVIHGFGSSLAFAGEVTTSAGLNILASEWFWLGGTVAVAGVCMWGVGYVVEESSDAVSGLKEKRMMHSNYNAEIVTRGHAPLTEDDIYR